MKLIQAMKKIKDLTAKSKDLILKIQNHSANLSVETPVYADQQKQVEEWIQAHHDILKEILGLRLNIQHTNLLTKVSIEINGKPVTKSIAGWIHRRRDLAKSELEAWASLTDRNLREQNLQTGPNQPVTEIRVRRYYDPAKRDQMIALFRSEPSEIDAALEVINATTEVVEFK